MFTDLTMATSDVDALLTNEESLQKYKNILLNQGITGLRLELNKNAEIWKSTNLTVAITGNSGAGKSTFINALLNLEGNNRAEAGIVETTTTYAEKVTLNKYDFFILISKSRFTENDVWLVETIKKLGKRFYFVRSHLQEEIENDEQSHPATHQPEKVIEEIKNDCIANLEQFEKEMFLIDSYELDKFDFPKLLNTLLRESGTFKAVLLAISLAPITQEVLDIKLSTLVLRHLREVVPRIGRDVITGDDCRELLLNEIAYYRKVFDIDEDRLKNEILFSLSESESRRLVLKVNMDTSLLVATTSIANSLCTSILDDFIKNRIVEGPVEDVFKTMIIAETAMLPLFTIMHVFHELASNLFQNVPLKFAEMQFLGERRKFSSNPEHDT